MKATVNIPFELEHDNVTGFTYVHNYDHLNASVYAGSINTAKKQLRDHIQTEIAEALKQKKEYQRQIIACASGEILIVGYRYSGWGYDIAGPGRKGCSSCSGFSSFEEACERARSHATDSYDGVLWECY